MSPRKAVMRIEVVVRVDGRYGSAGDRSIDTGSITENRVQVLQLITVRPLSLRMIVPADPALTDSTTPSTSGTSRWRTGPVTPKPPAACKEEISRCTWGRSSSGCPARGLGAVSISVIGRVRIRRREAGGMSAHAREPPRLSASA